MGEYLGPDALDRLLGGGGGAGLLPALVRRQPFCVLLLDELEKAHPVVFDALLGVLGEGRLSDADGKVTDFRNAVIVMTTNLGADTMRARVGFGGGDEASDEEAVRRHYVAEAQRFFRPEFFNRLDDLIVFRPLGEQAIRSIVRREVERLGQREGLVRRDLELATSEGSLDLLAREGLDPRLGARPLKRAIERRLAVPAASWLASHRQGGPTRLLVEVDEGRPGLSFRAESLHQDAAGSRAHAERVLDEAADLRALVGRWDRSAAARSLRARHEVVAHSLSRKGFWDDKSLAEDLAREGSLLQSIVEPLDELRRGAEAAEDLAVEAWYDRQADTIDTIRGELGVLHQRFAPLPRRVYLAREPTTTAALVYLSATRQNWHDLVGLFWLYRRWAEAHQLHVRPHVSEFIPVEERPGTKLDDPEHAWRWVERDPFGEGGTPIPAVAALEVRGSAEVNFLRIEEGGHRFADGSGSLVRVRFLPFDPRVGAKLRRVKDVLERMRPGDVRR
ncbi:MAG: ATP-dependent Clp protease ATP-binding subunit, partial [Myxococcales bacterium]